MLRKVVAILTVGFTLGGVNCGDGSEQRVWTSNTGEHTVEAKFVRVNQDQVVLRKADGKQIEVPLTKLSEADRELASELDKARLDRIEIEKTTRRFLTLLRQTGRDDAVELVTMKSKELWETHQSPIKDIPSVDRGSKPRIRNVDVRETEADVEAVLRYKGRSYLATLHLRYEDGSWLLFAASGENEEGDPLYFNFEGDEPRESGNATDYASSKRERAEERARREEDRTGDPRREGDDTILASNPDHSADDEGR